MTLESPWDNCIDEWKSGEGGMVASVSRNWVEAEFDVGWLRALRGNVLELGPGGGRQTVFLAENSTVDLADISQKLMDAVGEVVKVRNKLLITTSGDIPTDGPYDGFVACYVFCHCSIRDMWFYLKKARQIVRLGGTIIFDVKGANNFQGWESFSRYYLRQDSDRVGTGDFQLRFASGELVRWMCQSLKLKITDTHEYQIGSVAYRAVVER